MYVDVFQSSKLDTQKFMFSETIKMVELKQYLQSHCNIFRPFGTEIKDFTNNIYFQRRNPFLREKSRWRA